MTTVTDSRPSGGGASRYYLAPSTASAEEFWLMDGQTGQPLEPRFPGELAGVLLAVLQTYDTMAPTYTGPA